MASSATPSRARACSAMSPVPPPTGGTTTTSRPPLVRASRTGSRARVDPPYPLTSRTGPGSSWATGVTDAVSRTTTAATTARAPSSPPARPAAPAVVARGPRWRARSGSGVGADVLLDERGDLVGVRDDAPVTGVEPLDPQVRAGPVEVLQEHVGEEPVALLVDDEDGYVGVQQGAAAAPAEHVRTVDPEPVHGVAGQLRAPVTTG